MNDVTRILWSGITGRTGVEAMAIASKRNDVQIVAGLSRHGREDIPVNIADRLSPLEFWAGYNGNIINLSMLIRSLGIDVIVDFSHPNVLNQVAELAIRTNTPLIVGTSGLSNRQMALLYDAARQVPVFVGGNFRFKVKKFIDEAVKLAKTHNGDLILYEQFYKGKSLPSETSKVIRRRLMAETGREVAIASTTPFAKGNLICDWEFQVRNLAEHELQIDKVSCRTIGFDELAHDVLEIAKIMAHKPIKEDWSFYDLDEIWPDLTISSSTSS